MDAANTSQVVSTLTLANAAWERALERGQNIFAGVFGPMQAGVILAVCGNLVIACALALQKWARLRVRVRVRVRVSDGVVLGLGLGTRTRTRTRT